MGLPPGDKDGYRLAFDIALRAIDEQRATLAEVRQRANNLLAIAFGAGGIIASIIFTSDAAKNITEHGLAGGPFWPHLEVPGWFGCTVFTWWSTGGWGFNANPVGMVVQVNQGLEEARIYHDQAVHIGKAVRDIRKKLKCRLRAFNTGLWFMLAEIAGLSILIRDVANA